MITVFIRTLILYLLIMAGLRLMGKRQIGQLEPSELVLTMMLSDLATVPMQDMGIPLLFGILPILTLLSLSLLLSQLSLKSIPFRELVCGRPSILIQNGIVQQRAMRENRYTADELLEQLRIQGVSRIEDVQYAILENSGQLSVLPRPVSPEQEAVTLPVLLVSDGRTLSRNLQACGKNQAWLEQALKKQGIQSPADLFLLTLDQNEHLFFIRKEVSP